MKAVVSLLILTITASVEAGDPPALPPGLGITPSLPPGLIPEDTVQQADLSSYIDDTEEITGSFTKVIKKSSLQKYFFLHKIMKF